MKYATYVDGVVDIVFLEKPTGITTHDIPDDVFSGFTINEDNTFTAPPTDSESFKKLERPAFLFMALKLGLDETDILTLISKLPSDTEEDQQTKILAEIVFKNQQHFERENTLLRALISSSGITEEQVDTAWRIGEKLSW